MPHVPPRADGVQGSPALFTDLYELTMVQAYVAHAVGDVQPVRAHAAQDA